MRDAVYLARKDLSLMFRAGSTWLWAFLMPVLFFFFIGSVTGGFSRPRGTVEPIGMWAPENAGFLADHLARRLTGLGYRVRRVWNQTELEGYARRLAVPENFTADVLNGRQARLRFSSSGSGLSGFYDRFRVKRAAYTVLADVLLTGKDGAMTSPEALEAVASAPRNLSLTVTPAGKRKLIPSGFQQAVPGSMVMFILLAMFTTGGISLFQERELGILKRLASTPMSRASVVAGKWMSRFALGLIQIAFGMAAGTWLFRVDWGPHLGAVAVLLAAYAALASICGMLLGALGRTEGQIVALGVILSNAMAMAGGCWWPAEITPLWAQRIGLLLPTGWAMDGLHRLMSFGDAPPAVVPHLTALLVAGLAAAMALARRFRFQ
jgi:ABC-type multidrug transport system permease subunit